MEKIFSSKEWLSLKGVDRAQILLVVKGKKLGTIVGGNNATKRILRKLDLFYKEKLFKGYQVFTISKNEKILNDYLKGKEESHKKNGEFLSYPHCCIREYSRKRTKKELEECKKSGKKLSYRLGGQIILLNSKKKNYPDYLNYCPPSFTPCSVNCKRAKKILSKWKRTLIKEDPKAAKELKKFNEEFLRGL